MDHREFLVSNKVDNRLGTEEERRHSLHIFAFCSEVLGDCFQLNYRSIQVNYKLYQFRGHPDTFEGQFRGRSGGICGREGEVEDGCREDADGDRLGYWKERITLNSGKDTSILGGGDFKRRRQLVEFDLDEPLELALHILELDSLAVEDRDEGLQLLELFVTKGTHLDDSVII